MMYVCMPISGTNNFLLLSVFIRLVLFWSFQTGTYTCFFVGIWNEKRKHDCRKKKREKITFFFALLYFQFRLKITDGIVTLQLYERGFVNHNSNNKPYNDEGKQKEEEEKIEERTKEWIKKK